MKQSQISQAIDSPSLQCLKFPFTEVLMAESQLLKKLMFQETQEVT